VIAHIGTLRDINTGVIENMFTADLSYLQEFYRRINEGGDSMGVVACPSCKSEFDVHPGELMVPVAA
jgi:hypothetical protein